MSTFLERKYQEPFFDAMIGGCKRAILIWPRRHGKDVAAFMEMLSEALVNVGIYYYIFPSLKQGRKIFWQGRLGKELDSMKFRDLVKPEWLWPDPKKGLNETDMTIRLRDPDDPAKEGSMIQVIGAHDKEADSIVGTNPIYLLFSEYPLIPPAVFDLMAPILAENGGKAVFCYTPRGKNHGWTLYQGALKSLKWFVSKLTVDDTCRADGLPVITQEAIEDERLRGADEATIQQEYYTSFDGGVSGGYYTEQLNMAWANNRVCDDLYDPYYDVKTAWDLGHGDAMACLFYQEYDGFINWIDCIEEAGKDIPYFAMKIQERATLFGYRYAMHSFPHDISVHEIGAGNSRWKQLVTHRLTPRRKAPKLSLADGINAVRSKFRIYRFSKARATRILEALADYSRKKDEKANVFLDEPAKTWGRHIADAVRTQAVLKEVPDKFKQSQLPQFATVSDNPFPQGKSTSQWTTKSYRVPV